MSHGRHNHQGYEHGGVEKRDIIFHALFGEDRQYLAEACHAISQRLFNLTGVECVRDAMGKILQDVQAQPIDVLRSLFFLMVNMDMPFKEYVCEVEDSALFLQAFNLANVPADRLCQLHAYSLVGCKSVERTRARAFFVSLREIVKRWLSIETLRPADLVAKVKEEYLVHGG